MPLQKLVKSLKGQGKETLTAQLNDKYRNKLQRKKQEIFASNVREGGHDLAVILQRLNSNADLSEKVVEDQGELLSDYTSPFGMTALVETIKSAGDLGQNQAEISQELQMVKKEYNVPATFSVNSAAKVDMNGKIIDVEVSTTIGPISINAGTTIELQLDSYEVSETTLHFGKFGIYVTYTFRYKKDGVLADPKKIEITVKKEDAYDFEEYMGLPHGQDSKFLNDILPDDATTEEKEKYKALLAEARTEEGAITDLTEEDWISDQPGTDTYQCYQASKDMVIAAGYHPNNATRVYQLALEENDKDGKLIRDQDQMKKGIDAILNMVEKGQPVQVGVDYRSEKSHAVNNYDQTTDHFVVLSSLHHDNATGEFYFLFYENGTRFGPGEPDDTGEEVGVSDQNRIYIRKDDNGNYRLQGTVGPPGDRDASRKGIRLYEVTQIRINEEIPTSDTPDTINQDNFTTGCATRKCY